MWADTEPKRDKDDEIQQGSRCKIDPNTNKFQQGVLLSIFNPTAVVLKLFHVKDPQIDPNQLADPHLKRDAWDPHIKEDFYRFSSDFQPF